jgi:hypothetical protein
MSKIAGCHSSALASSQPRQRLVTGAWNALETALARRCAPLRPVASTWAGLHPVVCNTAPQRATCIAVHSHACRGSSLCTESRSAGHVSRLRSAIHDGTIFAFFARAALVLHSILLTAYIRVPRHSEFVCFNNASAVFCTFYRGARGRPRPRLGPRGGRGPARGR